MARAILLSVPLFLAACSDTGVKAFNAEPEAEILSHSDGQEVLEGYTESFTGQVSDPDHSQDSLTVTWYANGEVACESTTAEADGSTSCDILIDIETTEVRLDVLDPGGAAGSDRVELSVSPTESPEAQITAPTADGVYYSDQLVTFSGVLSDGEDAATDLVAIWESNLDGVLEAEATPNDDGEVIGYDYLSEGEHAIELQVTDTTGKEGTASVIIEVGPPNSAPSCAITAPENESADEEGTTVLFEATVGDVDVPADWLSVSWESDKDGDLGESTPDSTGSVAFLYGDLSIDSHVITLTVTDEVGATCSDYIIYSVGTAPSISVTSPVSGDVVDEGELVSFQATVSDGEDSPTDLSIGWVSDLDGEFSTQGSDSTGTVLFNESGLSIGLHSITATVTDTDGLYAQAILALRVNGLPTAPEVVLTPDPADTRDDLVVTILTDSTDPEGASVSYSYAWSVDGVPSSASSSATLDSADTAKGETWTVEVTPNDGTADGPSGSDDQVIDNTLPEITSVTISPDPATDIDTLNCAWSFYDEDGDADESALVWSIDGVSLGTDPDLSTGFVAGDEVVCTVTSHDGEAAGTSDSAAIVIQQSNTAPEVTEVSLSPSTVYTNDTITASVSTDDADGDAVSVSYAWYVDGSLVGETGTSLDGTTDFDKDQEVHVVVTPNDGTTDGDTVTSDSIIIDNTPPEAPEISLGLTISSTGSDSDGDGVNDEDDECPGYDDGDWSAMGDGERCLMVVEDTSSDWEAAEWACNSYGGNLVRIASEADNDQLSTLASGLPNEHIWIGYTDIGSEGTWEWIDGEASTYTNWRSGEPSGGSSEDCATLYHYSSYTGQWNDLSCGGNGYEGGYACQVAVEPDLYMDAMLCSIDTESSDDDGDTISYTFEWTVDGSSYTDATTTDETGDTVPQSDLYLGEAWTCTVTPNDGDEDGSSASVSVEMTACDLGTGEECPGEDCLQLLEEGYSSGDGYYWIDPDDTGAVEVYCDMTTADGGWTLVTVFSDDGQDTWTWNDQDYWTADTTTFGDVYDVSSDFKSDVYHRLAFSDVLFVHSTPDDPSDPIWASYHDVGDDSQDLGTFLSGYGTILDYTSGGEFSMSDGTLTVDRDLCATDLYINPCDQDGTGACLGPGEDQVIGFAWSANNNDGCPLDDPGMTGGLGPYSQSASNEEPSLGFGYGLELNTGASNSGENYMEMYLRRAPDGSAGLDECVPVETYGDGIDTDGDGLDCQSCLYGSTYFALCDGYYFDWDEAEDACIDAGYDGLTSIRDATESQIMEDLMSSSGNNYSWHGYIEDSSGWYWSDGDTSTYTNWAPGEPNGDGDCGTIEGTTGYNWNDLDCSRTDPSGFICASR